MSVYMTRLFLKTRHLPIVYRNITTSSLSLHSVDSEKNDPHNSHHSQESAHQPLSWFQKTLLSTGAGIGCLLRPQRDDLISTFGETSGQFALERIQSIMNENETGSRILREKPIIRSHTVDLDFLRSLPPHTLGKTYTDFLDKYNYSPDARRQVRFVEDPELAYVMLRYREVHDLVHTILCQPTNMLGEVVVKWVEAIQTRLPMCVTAAWFGSLRLRPKQRQKYIETYLPYALRVGHNSKFFMNFYFEENWEMPLSEVWRELNIEPPPKPV